MTAMDSRPDSRMRCRTAWSSSPKRSASTTNTTRSASASAEAAVRFMARLSARFSPRCRPGVSTKAICTPGRLSMPSTRWRVVCGRDVTMESFSPTSALSSVDLPTLGRPTSAAKPARNVRRVASVPAPERFLQSYNPNARNAACAASLLGTAPARPFALGLERGMRDDAGNQEGLRMRLAAGALDGVHAAARGHWPAGIPAGASSHP